MRNEREGKKVNVAQYSRQQQPELKKIPPLLMRVNETDNNSFTRSSHSTNSWSAYVELSRDRKSVV